MFWFVRTTQMVVEYMGSCLIQKNDEARTERERFDFSLNAIFRKHFGVFGDTSDTSSITFSLMRHF